jgi:glycosyltransferase involved in cell wall biosynthesis
MSHGSIGPRYAYSDEIRPRTHSDLRPGGSARTMDKPECNGGKKLRIAMLGSRGIPHTYSGYEPFLEEIGSRLVARGHEVIVYCRSGLFRNRPKSHKGMRLIYLPGIESKTMGTLTHTIVSMCDVIFRGVDVLFVVNVANAFPCVIPRLLGKKVAINVDGLDWKRDKWGPLAKKYFYWNARSVGRICPNGVVTDAREMQKIYLEEFGTRSVSIAYGADVETSVDAEVVRKYGLEPFQYYLIASRLVPENSADLIVKAFEQVHTPRVLAIAGSANYRSEFVEHLKQTGDRRVRFLGHVSDPGHVKELHCNAYAYIHGHSLGGTNPALLKALSLGNCVLALNTPFNREALHDYGILFEREAADLARKLQYIEDHPEQALEYRLRAPCRVREAYTWETITDQYEELFLELALGKDPTRVHSTVLSGISVRARSATGAVAASERLDSQVTSRTS